MFKKVDELINEELRPRSSPDCWCLGVIACHMLHITGRNLNPTVTGNGTHVHSKRIVVIVIVVVSTATGEASSEFSAVLEDISANLLSLCRIPANTQKRLVAQGRSMLGKGSCWYSSFFLEKNSDNR